MKNAQITPLTMDEFMEAVETVSGGLQSEQIDHAGMIASKFKRHPEYGDMILVAGQEEGGFMIHQSTSEVVGTECGTVARITDAQLADIIVESGDSVETSMHGGMDINVVHHPQMGRLTLISSA